MFFSQFFCCLVSRRAMSGWDCASLRGLCFRFRVPLLLAWLASSLHVCGTSGLKATVITWRYGPLNAYKA